mmetsp:Transcript_84877/g.240535  ORF Transcript_84877/g.240535 Transcript_84877/m.240535 type:complete len:239 (-) Transcript_84877:3-719(-)
MALPARQRANTQAHGTSRLVETSPPVCADAHTRWPTSWSRAARLRNLCIYCCLQRRCLWSKLSDQDGLPGPIARLHGRKVVREADAALTTPVLTLGRVLLVQLDRAVEERELGHPRARAMLLPLMLPEGLVPRVERRAGEPDLLHLPQNRLQVVQREARPRAASCPLGPQAMDGQLLGPGALLHPELEAVAAGVRAVRGRAEHRQEGARGERAEGHRSAWKREAGLRGRPRGTCGEVA